MPEAGRPALAAFREAFFRWLEDHAHDWPHNRDYMKASVVGGSELDTDLQAFRW